MMAHWWKALVDGRIQCELCPRHCTLSEGQRGFCFVRRAEGGQLLSESYGLISGLAVDPIEKKPLYHFLPGSRTLSFGSLGCNLGCRFCQNWSLSRGKDLDRLTRIKPEEIVQAALDSGCRSVAFTYNEPLVAAEFCIEVAQACQEAGLRTVAVTAGYVNPEPRAEFFRHMDAANVDLKAFSEAFYRDFCSARLEPVLESLESIAQETECWLEVTNLLIPGANDSEEELEKLCAWLMEHLGPEVPLHFSAFLPSYQLQDRMATPASSLHRARRIGRQAGLQNIYLGNIREGNSTCCAQCGAELIQRQGFGWLTQKLQDGHCPQCQALLPGIF